MSVKTWTVVHFVNDNSVAAVPSTWIKGENEEAMCYWPPFAGEVLSQTLKRHDPFNEEWQLFPCKLFKNGTFDDYTYARQKAKKAEEQSELSSDEYAKKRKKVPRAKYSTSESESECSSLPTPPILKKKRIPPAHSSLEQRHAAPFSDRQQETIEVSVPTVIRSDKKCSEATAQGISGISLNRVTVSSSHSSPLLLPERADLRGLCNKNQCACCASVKQLQDLIQNIGKQQIIHKHALFDLARDMADIKTLLQTLSLGQQPAALQDESESIFKKLELPITDPTKINVLEDYLADENNMRSAKIEVSRIGGNDGADFIKRALSRLLHDQVLKTRNWEGKKGKLPFKNLRTSELLLASLAMNQKIEDEKVGSTLIKNFMRNANERLRQANAVRNNNNA